MGVISMKSINPDQVPKRKTKTIDIHVTELPERRVHVLKTNRDRDKLIKQCEKIIRGSLEYKDYIQTCRLDYGMTNCAILPSVARNSGKKYTIEIHHEPFTLYDIVDLEIIRREEEHEPLNVNEISESVMALHHDGMVGLISLSKTQHELVDAHKVFIPLQHIFFDYSKLYEYYQTYIETKAEHIRKKIELKLKLSLECGDLQSEAASPEFVYLNIDGIPLPEVKEDWINCLERDRKIMAAEDKKREDEEKKAAKKKKQEETSVQ